MTPPSHLFDHDCCLPALQLSASCAHPPLGDPKGFELLSLLSLFPPLWVSFRKIRSIRSSQLVLCHPSPAERGCRFTPRFLPTRPSGGAFTSQRCLLAALRLRALCRGTAAASTAWRGIRRVQNSRQRPMIARCPSLLTLTTIRLPTFPNHGHPPRRRRGAVLTSRKPRHINHLTSLLRSSELSTPCLAPPSPLASVPSRS